MGNNDNRTILFAALIIAIGLLVGLTAGKIHSANQGSIQIFGSDGNDESSPYSPTSMPMKKIRVVSTFEFELK